MKTTLNIAIVIFAGAALAQVFIPRHLPQALAYCVCAWILAHIKEEM